jgi:hypothetical protein
VFTFDEVERSELYEGYDSDAKLDICECIRALLNQKNWALARKSKHVARQSAKFYADITPIIPSTTSMACRSLPRLTYESKCGIALPLRCGTS